MSVTLNVSLTGTNKLGSIALGMEGKAAEIIQKTAFDLQSRAQLYAPVDTGNLRASIQAKEVTKLHWQVIVGAEYGAYVEFGTRFMAAQPYLIPAADQVRDSFIQAMKRVTDA